MEQVLGEIDYVKVILNDVPIKGKMKEQLKTLELVLARLKDNGLMINPAKYHFFLKDSVVFCAYPMTIFFLKDSVVFCAHTLTNKKDNINEII